MSLIDCLLSHILHIEDCVTDKTQLQARSCLLDYLSVCIGGSRSLSLASDIPSSLRMGMTAHVLELDDGHRRGAVHVGATVFSALMSVAEKKKLSSQDFLLGAIVGYEVTIRLACAVQPGNKLRGYHATGTCGTVGAALGIAAALHYTKEQMNTTLAAAVTSAAGVLEMQEDDSDLKPYNVGRAAMDAVAAAYIGRTGLKGPKDALGGKRGFLKVMTDEPHTEYLTEFSSDTLCIEQIYQKVYAACRHAHPAIEAALTLRSSVKIEEIEEIKVRAYKLAVAGHDHREFTSVSSAKMSIPFGVAVAFVIGNVGLKAFSEATINDNSILNLAKKVRVVADEELSVLCPEKRASILTIRTKSGSFSERVDNPKGEPENPLTQKELEAKFCELATFGGLSKSECEEVINEVWKEDVDVNKLIRIVNKSTGQRVNRTTSLQDNEPT